MSVQLFSCTTWTLTKRLEKKVDRNYTKMLCAVWTNPTKKKLYSHLPPIIKPSKWDEHHMLGKLWRTHKWRFPMKFYTGIHQCKPTGKKLYQPALCSHWIPSRELFRSDGGLGRVERERERERERESPGNLCCLHDLMMMMIYTLFDYLLRRTSIRAGFCI